MIARRSFIAGSLALLSRPAWPQERKAERIVRVGVLDPQPLAINAGNLEQLRKGLRGAGYSEGRNLAIEYRASDGRAGRYGSLAQELGRAGGAGSRPPARGARRRRAGQGTSCAISRSSLSA